MSEKLVVTPREAAQISGLPRDFVYEALRDGRLQAIRRGRNFLIPRRELDRFVEEEATGIGRSPPPEVQRSGPHGGRSVKDPEPESEFR
jgi:excisionase family DNA binding protein